MCLSIRHCSWANISGPDSRIFWFSFSQGVYWLCYHGRLLEKIQNIYIDFMNMLQSSMPFLATLSQIALVFFMFFLGLELDPQLMINNWRVALPVARMSDTHCCVFMCTIYTCVVMHVWLWASLIYMWSFQMFWGICFIVCWIIIYEYCYDSYIHDDICIYVVDLYLLFKYS